ncbi:DUF1365 domain-containing protein [Pseudorhodobacter ferrugineus]|uniref:DUF1365 domain-containing protein n=1 Tax=Pseudorhodobacter ferrugineus TaxID=77008 RepID=UPI0003B640D8|nr:DUF1365 domain-containing protein [Pseudorhodobacter ferrugineus]
MSEVEYIAGETFHGRRGAVENAFRYHVDYVLLNPDQATGPRLFSRNRGNLTSVWDKDHGGAPKHGRGVAWLREVLSAHDLPGGDNVRLLTQPRVLGHVFNPVSFWLCHDAAGALRVVVAEVSNTFGDRHSYLCHRDDLAPITREDRIAAQKIFHVSPFQPVTGGYEFRFDISGERIGIWIDYTSGNGGLIATLTGVRAPLTNGAILRACLRRPFGSRRVLALIHWQALKLWVKRAPFFTRPEPPEQDVSK